MSKKDCVVGIQPIKLHNPLFPPPTRVNLLVLGALVLAGWFEYRMRPFATAKSIGPLFPWLRQTTCNIQSLTCQLLDIPPSTFLNAPLLVDPFKI